MSSDKKTKDYEIKGYILKEDIGEGNFGKVKLGISKSTGEKFAVKIINKDQIKKKMKNKIFRENEVITKFNHINVIFVFEIIEDQDNYYIIMEYCKRGELFDYIVDHERLTEDEAAIFFYQLINGVEYIHSRGIAHRDLKPENLLLTKDKTLKIIDFGLSHEFDGIEFLKTKCGSPSYASPEILRGKPYDGFKSDIWCCGIILYAMVCGYLPFDGETNKILFKNIMKCQPEIPDYLNESTQDLIIRILTSDPDMRITIDDIKRHRFYLRGKKLCHIDYKMIEKNVLKKRKNKSSFRLNEDDNTYFIAEHNLDYEEDIKKQILSREEKDINDIIKGANSKNVEDKKIKENKEKINNNNLNEEKNNVIKEEKSNEINNTLNNNNNGEPLVKNTSIGNSSNELNNAKIENNSNQKQSSTSNKMELNSFKESIANDSNRIHSRESSSKINNLNEMDAIFSSKRLNNNYENIHFNNLKSVNENNIKGDIENNFVEKNTKKDKFNQYLQNIGKNLQINTINTNNNETNLKSLKLNTNNIDTNQKTLDCHSPGKIFLNKYIPTPKIVLNGKNRNHTLNANNNQIFTKIKNSFNRNFFNNNYKKNLFFNNFNSVLRKKKNISNEQKSNNANNELANNNVYKYIDSHCNINSIKNTLFKNKSPEKLSLNSFHQIKLTNCKPPSKDTQNLYYNNINININNFNIKQANNKKENDNYIPNINYLNTDNQKYKINRKFSNTNLNNAKKLYLNTENNKEVPKKLKFETNETNSKNIPNNNYISLTYGNKNIKTPSKTQDNFYKPKKHLTFDKISFHSINGKKRLINKNINLQITKHVFENKKSKNEKMKIRGRSEGKPFKNSHLDHLLQTIAANGFYKNKKGNKKIYFCGPINIKVNNNNFNVNNEKQQFLPVMFKNK